MVELLRTQAEIVDRVNATKEEFLSFTPEVLLPYLDFEHAREFLEKGTTKAAWDKERSEYTREQVFCEAEVYMKDYGWPKVTGHRGISAGRTIQKMEVWMWLVGENALVEICRDESRYPQYGAPILKEICEAFGWPMPDDEGAARMMKGEPCGSYDGCGCG